MSDTDIPTIPSKSAIKSWTVWINLIVVVLTAGLGFLTENAIITASVATPILAVVNILLRVFKTDKGINSLF